MALCKIFPGSATRDNEFDLAVKMRTVRTMCLRAKGLRLIDGSEIPEADRFLMFFT